MPTASSDDLLQHLAHSFPRVVELSLRPDYFALLAALGNPQHHLPPIIHVAGTNGKGSSCAFLRAMLEAAGKRVHVYTSPHLVRFHERIRLAGRLIAEAELVALLQDVANLITPNSISQFEATTAAAFKAFATHPADYLILETGLGGRFDATNIIAKPLASLITRISYDHREFLGDSLAKIAGEKAGIIKTNTPCFMGFQADEIVNEVVQAEATAKAAPLFMAGRDWRISTDTAGWRYEDKYGALNLPLPALAGAHQIQNAAAAIATLRHALPTPLPTAAYAKGLQTASWPARLQRLDSEKLLAAPLPQGWELWLDGGHNDSAGEVLAAQAAAWQQQDKNSLAFITAQPPHQPCENITAQPPHQPCENITAQPPRQPCAKPLHLIFAMLNTKVPQEFLQPLAPYATTLCAVPIPDTPNALPTDILATAATACGIKNIFTATTVTEALRHYQALSSPPCRILICGSLYLAGAVLAKYDSN